MQGMRIGYSHMVLNSSPRSRNLFAVGQLGLGEHSDNSNFAIRVRSELAILVEHL